MKRRSFLRLGALTLFGAAGSFWASSEPGRPIAFVPRMAHAATGRGRTVIVLFLRGGLDGLHAVVPYGDRRYHQARPKLGIRPPGKERGALDLDGRFGLHPDLAPLLPLYRDGSLAVVHAVGTPVSSRSHFHAQDFLETGGFPPGPRDGFLNRYLARRGESKALMRALSTIPGVPTTLLGEVPAASLMGLGDVDVGTPEQTEAILGPASQAMRAASDPQVRRMADHTFRVTQSLRALDPASYRPAKGAKYPETPLGAQFELIAFLLKSKVGLEAVHAELDGFDTHAGQVAAEGGLEPLLRDVAASLAAFWKDLGPLGEDVVVTTLTEFGRRFKENGSMGTDHGRASCCFVLGGRVRGGRVYGRWPGLGPEQLFQGMDLEVTTDYRDLLVELAGASGCPEPTALFPGFRGKGALGIV